MTVTEGLSKCSAMLLWVSQSPNLTRSSMDRRKKKGVEFDVDLETDDLKEIISGYKTLYKNEIGSDFPQEPKEQLMEAIKAVFRSWNTDRAILYRQINEIPDHIGTAVNVPVYGIRKHGRHFRNGCCIYQIAG